MEVLREDLRAWISRAPFGFSYNQVAIIITLGFFKDLVAAVVTTMVTARVGNLQYLESSQK